MIITNEFKPESLHVAKHEGVIINLVPSQAFLFGEDMGRFKRTIGALCACGCGKRTKWRYWDKTWSKFIHGHSTKGKDKYAKEKAESHPLCACGCKKPTQWSYTYKKWNKYIHGHQRRNLEITKLKAQPAPLCACGCGERVKWCTTRRRWNKYVYKHNGRTQNYFTILKEKTPLCGCGCGQPVTQNQNHKRWNKFIYGHNIRYIHPMKIPEIAKKVSEKMKAKGENHPMKTPEARAKVSKRMLKLDTNHWMKLTEHRKRSSKRMKNGGAAYILSFIKNPSKPQGALFKLIQQIYSNAILNYPSLNRSIDIAIPDKMIAIEYDGSYWHQDKEKDKIRQKELEAIGWNFLRYCDYVPSINELKKDLQQII